MCSVYILQVRSSTANTYSLMTRLPLCDVIRVLYVAVVHVDTGDATCRLRSRNVTSLRTTALCRGPSFPCLISGRMRCPAPAGPSSARRPAPGTRCCRRSARSRRRWVWTTRAALTMRPRGTPGPVWGRHRPAAASQWRTYRATTCVTRRASREGGGLSTRRPSPVRGRETAAPHATSSPPTSAERSPSRNTSSTRSGTAREPATQRRRCTTRGCSRRTTSSTRCWATTGDSRSNISTAWTRRPCLMSTAPSSRRLSTCSTSTARRITCSGLGSETPEA